MKMKVRGDIRASDRRGTAEEAWEYGRGNAANQPITDQYQQT